MADVVGSTLRIWHYHSCLCGRGERRLEIHKNGKQGCALPLSYSRMAVTVVSILSPFGRACQLLSLPLCRRARTNSGQAACR